jgi:hypothetical protein
VPNSRTPSAEIDRAERPFRRLDQQQVIQYRLECGVGEGDLRQCGARWGHGGIGGEQAAVIGRNTPFRVADLNCAKQADDL